MTTGTARLNLPPGSSDGASFLTRVRRRNWFPYLMTVPAVLVVVAMVIYPMAYSLFVSFTPFHLLRPEPPRAPPLAPTARPPQVSPAVLFTCRNQRTERRGSVRLMAHPRTATLGCDRVVVNRGNSRLAPNPGQSRCP